MTEEIAKPNRKKAIMLTDHPMKQQFHGLGRGRNNFVESANKQGMTGQILYLVYPQPKSSTMCIAPSLETAVSA